MKKLIWPILAVSLGMSLCVANASAGTCAKLTEKKSACVLNTEKAKCSKPNVNCSKAAAKACAKAQASSCGTPAIVQNNNCAQTNSCNKTNVPPTTNPNTFFNARRDINNFTAAYQQGCSFSDLSTQANTLSTTLNQIALTSTDAKFTSLVKQIDQVNAQIQSRTTATPNDKSLKNLFIQLNTLVNKVEAGRFADITEEAAELNK